MISGIWNEWSKIKSSDYKLKGTLEVVNTMIISGFTAFTSTFKGNLELEVYTSYHPIILWLELWTDYENLKSVPIL